MWFPIKTSLRVATSSSFNSDQDPEPKYNCRRFTCLIMAGGRSNQKDSSASLKSSEFDELDSEHMVSAEEIDSRIEAGSKEIKCSLEIDIEEHILATLIYWSRITSRKWSCVQVLTVETITEEKRYLILEIQDEKDVYDVKYFVASEFGDNYMVDDFELTKQSKNKLSKMKLKGAKLKK